MWCFVGIGRNSRSKRTHKTADRRKACTTPVLPSSSSKGVDDRIHSSELVDMRLAFVALAAALDNFRTSLA
jgi:hypothetical protein